MTNELLNDNSERVFDFDYYMNKIDNLTLSVLKGHLLTEWALDQFAKLRFSESEYQELGKLRFKKRVLKVKASVQHTSAHVGWDLVLMLNEIRNEYAHELEPDVRGKFDDLFRIDEKLHNDFSDIHSAAFTERLNRAMQHCFEFLLALDHLEK
jgi:hypothetical protein